jgi:citrate lyase beta subunit
MLPDTVLAELDTLLAGDDERREATYPGPASGRQPVHTVYIPADRFGPETLTRWAALALAELDRCEPLPDDLAAQAGRVRAKLRSEPVEDLRIDFEDGYGGRPDDEEDEHARRAARSVGALMNQGSCPAFVGLRIRSLERATRKRALRTLDLFLDGLITTAGTLPNGFRVTLPKVTSVAQVEAMLALCYAAEHAYGVERLSFELQVETPQAIVGADGRALVAPMLHAARGRCLSLHYGTYDYSASVGVAGPYQSLDHPAADHAKAVMQVASAATGATVSDGSTNVIPSGSPAEVRRAWSEHARLVRRSLQRGFYQGWDLHPAQLPSRFAATFDFYCDGAEEVADRLRRYLNRIESGVLDEPATATAMAGFLLRGLDSGALDEDSVLTLTGLQRTALTRLARRGHG